MEKIETSERGRLHWCYEGSIAICVGVDAQRNLDRVSR